MAFVALNFSMVNPESHPHQLLEQNTLPVQLLVWKSKIMVHLLESLFCPKLRNQRIPISVTGLFESSFI